MNYTKINLNVCQCYIVLIKTNYIPTALENMIIGQQTAMNSMRTSKISNKTLTPKTKIYNTQKLLYSLYNVCYTK